jgi:4-amino-4-deoxy-L-arabinose transferase-like glycosyltransferase
VELMGHAKSVERFQGSIPARRRVWLVLTLSVFILVALLLRLHVAWERNHESPNELALRLVGDETDYDRLARELLQGSFFHWPGRVPVYPMFIAATYYALGESSPAKLLYVQACVGVMAVPLTYLLARRVLRRIPALAAAGVVAFDDLLVGHAWQMYAEILYTPLLLAALVVLLWAVQTSRPGHFVWAGASMALVTLCRPTTALIPLLLPLMLPRGWSLQQKTKASVVYGLAMMTVIAPWTYHNWRAYHRFLPLSVSVAALWQGSPEFYHLVQRNRGHLDIWANELNPERNGGHDPFTIDGDRYFTRRALQSIRAHPLAYIDYSLRKGAYFWFGNPAAEWGFLAFTWWYDWPTLRQTYPYSWLRLFNMVLARQLPLLALAALVYVGTRRRSQPLLPFVVVCAYFMLVHMLTWAEMRYSGPLHPLLAIFVMAAGTEIFGGRVRRRPSTGTTGGASSS